MDLVLVAVGLALLLGAGDALVRGAVALSLKLGIPALLVSLTIVAFGTSAPELLIAVQAALDGAPGIVYGNVVGSNIANVLIVLGVPALIARLHVRDSESMRNYVLMLASCVVFIALCWMGPLAAPHGLILLALLTFMLVDAYRSAQTARQENAAALEAELAEELGDADPSAPVWRIVAFLAVGLIGLPVGAHLLIDGARGVAIDMGVSEAAIGLTLIALGTSLPELATTVAAALRKQSDVAIGNVIGSNLFNIVAIMGVASFFGPLEVPQRILDVDLWIMLGTAVLMYPFVARMARLGRRMGMAFIVAYIAYVGLALAPHM